MNIEQELRQKLAACDPGPQFTASVLARLDVDGASPSQRAVRRSRWSMPVAMAASLLVAISGLALLHVHRMQRQAQAEQLQLALAIASERLNQVQQRLHRPYPTENGT